jgi:PRC-barrel domain
MLALVCSTGICGQLTDASSHAKTLLGQSEVDKNGTALKTPPAPSKIETPAVLIDDKHLESMLGKEIHTASDETVGNVTDILVDSEGSVRAAVVDLGGFLGVACERSPSRGRRSFRGKFAVRIRTNCALHLSTMQASLS